MIPLSVMHHVLLITAQSPAQVANVLQDIEEVEVFRVESCALFQNVTPLVLWTIAQDHAPAANVQTEIEATLEAFSVPLRGVILLVDLFGVVPVQAVNVPAP